MKTFYHILANNLIASIVNFTVWFAIIFYTYLETQSVFATSLISGLYLVSTAGSGFWFGSLVDNYKKKSMMILSSVISLVSYVLAFIIYASVPESTFTTIENPILWAFIVTLLVGVVIGNIRNIALPTIVTIMVKEDGRDKANGLVGTTSGISFLVTSVISGVLVGSSGMYGVLILAIILTAACIVHLWKTEISEKGVVHSDDAPKKIDIKGTMVAISKVPGLFALILFTTFNNFMGGVFMSLMDAYGLSMVSVQVWGFLFGILSLGFIVGGIYISKKGLGKNPLKSMFIANIIIWFISSVFTLQASIVLLGAGMFIYLCVVPFIEAAEHTIIQKVVPPERQGRVFGFAQSIEQAASPLTAFAIGPLTQFIFIPFMTTGAGVDLIGSWFGTGPARGIALVFTVTGVIGLCVTLAAMNSKYYKLLSKQFVKN